MPGSPISIGCSVVLTPGAAGPPDTGTIIAVFPPVPLAGGMPVATAGALCLMVNSVSGVPYVLPIGPAASSGVTAGGRALVRTLDRIPSGGILTILGPPAASWVIDQWAP